MSTDRNETPDIQLSLHKSFDSIERDITNILAHSTAVARGYMTFALTYNQYTSGVQYQTGGSAITHTIYGRNRSGTIRGRRAIQQNPPTQLQFPTP